MFVCVLALFPHASFAQVVITEVMYDLKSGSDSDREWIEVYNASAGTIELSNWKVFENGKNHAIKIVEGSFGPGSFAVIADNPTKFKADHPDFSGALFDSAFSLNNKGESIALYTSAGAEIDSVIYTTALGGNGTGDSLQKIDMTSGAALAPGMPTPGEDVPASGLLSAPRDEKTLQKEARAAAAAVPKPKIEGEPARPEARRQFALAAEEGNGIAVWLFGVFAITSFATAGAVYARAVKKTEWEIIEETCKSS